MSGPSWWGGAGDDERFRSPSPMADTMMGRALEYILPATPFATTKFSVEFGLKGTVCAMGLDGTLVEKKLAFATRCS